MALRLWGVAVIKGAAGMPHMASALGLAALIGVAASHSAAGTVTYRYDALGRVLSAAYPDGNCTAYQYDAAGNRSQYTSGASGAPVANNVNVTTYQDIAATFDPRVNGPGCAALTVSAVGTPSHGAAAIAGGGTGITYTPASGYTGADGFTYSISNGTSSSSGNVSVTVNAPTLPPVAMNGQWSYMANIIPPAHVTPTVTQSINPLVSDPYGYTLSVSTVTQGTYGAVTYSGNTITYTYHTSVGVNLELVDSFTYTVTDSHGNTATAVISVNIEVNTNQ
jgi:YD repeat-containing protein